MITLYEPAIPKEASPEIFQSFRKELILCTHALRSLIMAFERPVDFSLTSLWLSCFPNLKILQIYNGDLFLDQGTDSERKPLFPTSQAPFSLEELHFKRIDPKDWPIEALVWLLSTTAHKCTLRKLTLTSDKRKVAEWTQVFHSLSLLENLSEFTLILPPVHEYTTNYLPPVSAFMQSIVDHDIAELPGLLSLLPSSLHRLSLGGRGDSPLFLPQYLKQLLEGMTMRPRFLRLEVTSNLEIGEAWREDLLDILTRFEEKTRGRVEVWIKDERVDLMHLHPVHPSTFHQAQDEAWYLINRRKRLNALIQQMLNG
ncbi:hypothetical protein BT69DRAFT_1331929 [Atractiella rhizophila]|nr:hypothetical protein BT69DRAFT_1331929 [Atractiella rhizophila]